MKTLMTLALLLLATALGLAASPLAAHETTRSYLLLGSAQDDVRLRLRLAFRDIEVAVWMDENLDGQITWAEAQSALPRIDEYVASRVALDAGGACPLRRTGAGVLRDAGVDYLEIRALAECPDLSAPLHLRSDLFLDIDPDHRMFVSAQIGGARTSAVLGAADPELRLGEGSGRAIAAIPGYFVSGMEHLLGGPDHLVFLFVLILPAVAGGRGRVRQSILAVCTAATGFTIAHAVTLSASAIELMRPPSAFIEILIAGSIVLTAIDNIRPFIPAPRAATAALFGVFHGFGFASALGTLQLGSADLAAALFGFNLGIEVAQILAILLAFPLLRLALSQPRRYAIASVMAGALGLAWLLMRLAPVAAAVTAS